MDDSPSDRPPRRGGRERPHRLRSPDSFGAVLKRAEAGGSAHADLEAAAGAAEPRSVLLERWRACRAEVAVVLREIPLGQGFPWFGSELTAALMVPLRLMETWAHGQDIFDTLGVVHRPTDRLKHVAALGVAGRELSFYAARLPPLSEAFVSNSPAPSGLLPPGHPPQATLRNRPHRGRVRPLGNGWS
ncbi:maleylpyruvate isomerase N-terminal domain-containing protein [Amycolatopsis sp. NPDC089917]|uniref:maleylpyruvate isomerase N-terminal domain-containing protein n=1 Tax=Amycolatopsis sp. NPDC089917 TaxID=3155187 RepID=UPI003424B31B